MLLAHTRTHALLRLQKAHSIVWQRYNVIVNHSQTLYIDTLTGITNIWPQHMLRGISVCWL